MELCKKVQSEEYVIHVVGSTNFYTHLQFSLLADAWFPRPVGVCLWSALHVFLVLYETLMLLVLVPSVFVLAILMDAYMVLTMICVVLSLPVAVISYFLGIGIVIALVWLWLLISCKCCTMPGRAPGQGLGHYVRTAGGILDPQNAQLAPAGEGGAPVANGPCAFLHDWVTSSVTMKFVNHVILVSFPYRRAQLADLCREIVPWCDSIAI